MQEGGGGVITSVIVNVNRVAAKTMACMVVIGWDAGLITSSSRSKAWPCNDEGGLRFCNDTNRKRRRRRGGV